ncbi:peptidoglycan-binding domain-containing protein [Pseudonocardia xishanensis]|uniref:Peptidoglycan binding-like domain-containing protein n=1 Tax=Pseudonocardia xishanensis TaxID=630995 RepID=A0ABP8S024_9PSEU
MSTTDQRTSTDYPSGDQPTTDYDLTRTADHRRSGRGKTIAIVAGAALAAAGLTAGLFVGLSGGGSSSPSAPVPEATQITPIMVLPSSGGAVAVLPASSGHSVTPANGGGSHVTPPTPPAPPVKPSQAIETLQKELGQLNYYEGADTGIMNAQTTQAITYLQRDAHLPQTGTMNAATQAALTQMLATGDNQMGG